MCFSASSASPGGASLRLACRLPMIGQTVAELPTPPDLARPGPKHRSKLVTYRWARRSHRPTQRPSVCPTCSLADGAASRALLLNLLHGGPCGDADVGIGIRFGLIQSGEGVARRRADLAQSLSRVRADFAPLILQNSYQLFHGRLR